MIGMPTAKPVALATGKEVPTAVWVAVVAGAVAKRVETVALAGMFVPVMGMPTTKPEALVTGTKVPTTFCVAVEVGAVALIAVMTVPVGK